MNTFKATKKEIVEKVTSVTSTPQVYFKEANGTQGMRDFSALATPNAIVQRNALGQIIGVDATAANQLAPKGQIDTLIANNGKGIFIAEYGVTSYAEITAAVAAGKLPVAKDGVMYYTYVYSYDLEVPPTHMFFTFYDNTIQVIKTTVGVSWRQELIPIEVTDNKTTVLNASSTNVQYAGAKATYDLIQTKQAVLTNVTSTEIVNGTSTTQKSVTAKALNEAINLIMFNSLGGSS